MAMSRRLSWAWKPLTFSNMNIPRLPADKPIEEEKLPGYVASYYYPAQIGQILQRRYQVVGKLGFGATSTVWLARDLSVGRHVALKLFIHSSMEDKLDSELNIYKHIESASKDHPGRNAVRPLLDSFDVTGPMGRHRCLVHTPLWESILDLRHRNAERRLPESVVAFLLKSVFQALDLLHKDCHTVHTDIKEDNILLGADEAILVDFEQDELKKPCARKELDGRTIYQSRQLNLTLNWGLPVLCDLGSAVQLDEGEHREVIQPIVYRAPEVILDIPWTYSADIWNVGCLVWDILKGEHLFNELDDQAHLAEMIALLGPPPPELLDRANLRSKFFSDAGGFCAGIPIPKLTPLEHREMPIEEENRECFLRFMQKMLQWEPEKRSSAGELAEDEWIVKHTRDY